MVTVIFVGGTLNIEDVGPLDLEFKFVLYLMEQFNCDEI